MKLVERILAGLDFRTETDAVLQTVSLLAKQLGSEVSLMYVIPPVTSLSIPQEFGDVSSLVELAKKESAARLNEYSKRLEEEGVSMAKPVVAEGITFDKILAHADDFDPNVILASVGYSGTEQQAAIGITAERLCRKSSRPVWLIKPESKVPPKVILCPVDFGNPSARALRNAIFLARKFETQLNVLTVVPPVSTLYGWLLGIKESMQATQTDQHQKAFDEFLEHFDFQGIKWQKTIRHGAADSEILAEVEETSADLIVMGSVGRSGLSRIMLGSVAERVLQSAPCSMLFVKAEDAFRLQISDQVEDIDSHFQLGAELLKDGFVEEAKRKFQHCISANVMFAPAWEALADCHEKLGDIASAEECRAEAKQIRTTMNWRQVEADIRFRHPLWRRGG